jgi:sulfate transport system permease protein
MSTRGIKWRAHSVLPGFGVTIGFTITYLSLIVLIPLAALFARSSSLTLSELWEAVGSSRVVASYKLTFLASFLASLANLFFGFITAWVLVRYTFPGRKIVDALIDLPFALPTAVSGIALTTLYAPNGWFGQYFAPLGIKTAFSPLGIGIALLFIGLPFVVRTLQPAIAELDREVEEAAASLGASRVATFVKVLLPPLIPPALTGFAMAFARSIGEYGSVIFIAGNMPMKTEITSLLIITKLEQYDYAGATAIAVVMLLLSFALLFFINLLQWWSVRRYQGGMA